ncbi:class I tRNA ligase family protein, partial [Bacteroides xylanisolvens]|uniref:class I tRNA ligase family protein n=2 Tax=Bacteria TaxID=2 RepID=UPI001AA1516C
LPSNISLCVNPDEVYVKVKAADGFTYYMAEALVETVLTPIGKYEVLERCKGSELEYKEYEPLYSRAKEVADRQGK